MPSLGAETRKKTGPVPSLLGRGVLRFLDLHLQILPYPRMPFFPSNNQHPSPDLFFSLQRPVYPSLQHPHLFTIDSSCLPSHPCSMSGFALLLPPPSIHKEREKWRSRKRWCRLEDMEDTSDTATVPSPSENEYRLVMSTNSILLSGRTALLPTQP
jgi:hypothetical protein